MPLAGEHVDPAPLWAFITVMGMSLAILVGALLFGYFTAPEPPATGGAPEEAVLRVIAPAGKPYGIIWDYERLEVGQVDDDSTYKDHEVPSEAGSLEEGFNLALDRLENEAGENWDDPLQAILFVEGVYASCNASGVPVTRLYWRPDRDAGRLLIRAMCGLYQYTAATPR